MFFSKFSIFFVFFVLYLGADPAACRSEVVERLEKELLQKYLDLAVPTITKVVDIFSAIADELPADDPHTKALRLAAKLLNEDKAEVNILKSLKDGVESGDIQYKYLSHAEVDIEKADKEDSSNTAKYNELVKKHGDVKVVIDAAVLEMVEAIQKKWSEAYSGLSDADKQANPIYDEINDLGKILVGAPDLRNKVKLGVLILQDIVNIQETPHIFGMVRALHLHCGQDDTCDYFPELLSLEEIRELADDIAS